MRISRAERGFTLVETLIALAIVAGLAGLAVVALAPSRERGVIEMSVAVMRAALSQARLMAMTQDETVSVAVNAQNRSVTSRAGTATLPEGVRIEVAVGDGEVLAFHADGSANPAQIRLSAGLHERLITVDWLSGETQVAAGNER